MLPVGSGQRASLSKATLEPEAELAAPGSAPLGRKMPQEQALGHLIHMTMAGAKKAVTQDWTASPPILGLLVQVRSLPGLGCWGCSHSQ